MSSHRVHAGEEFGNSYLNSRNFRRAAETCEREKLRGDFLPGSEVPVDYIISRRSFPARVYHPDPLPLPFPRHIYTCSRPLNIHERDLRLLSDEITPDGLSVLIGTCTHRPNKLQMLSTISPEISPPLTGPPLKYPPGLRPR